MLLAKPGALPMIGVGPPNQVPTVAGMQGVGVNTPKAAAVAAAVVGLPSDIHSPHGEMLAIGAES
jgi:hypothetical protein